MTATRICFTGKQQIEVQSFDTGPLKSGEVLVRTHYTLMSTGTENIVLNRMFDADTIWDAWAKYPFYPGYSAVGEIVETGPGVDTRLAGRRVALKAGHASLHVEQADNVALAPDEIDSREAVWFVLAMVAFMGARAGEYQLGDSVLIIGAGPIGQMSVRWAAAAGLEHIIVVDPAGRRLDLATRGGATAVIDLPVEECKDAVLAATGGKPPRVVNDATGNAAVFATALRLVDTFGRVVILGDTGSPVSQHLTHDVITRGITIKGAHDGHVDEIWHEMSIARLFFSLAARGRFDLKGLTSHLFRPEDAQAAYDTANTRRGETMGILFDWTEGKGK